MRITRRHMFLASACGLLLMALLYYGLIISPAVSERKKLISRIADRDSDLKQMKALKNEWEAFQDMRKEAEQRLARKGQSFTLLSFLETISRAVGVDKKIQYMKPLSLPREDGELRPEGIEMSLDQLNTKELVTFLHRIEYSGKLLHIKRIKIQKSSKDKTIKVTLQVTSYSAA